MSCIKGKAFKASEVFKGSKSLSTKRPPANTSNGKMSGAHGVVPPGPTKNMSNAAGRLGAGTRGFKNNFSSTTGGEKGGPKHAGQPSGHKDKA